MIPRRTFRKRINTDRKFYHRDSKGTEGTEAFAKHFLDRMYRMNMINPKFSPAGGERWVMVQYAFPRWTVGTRKNERIKRT